MLLLSTQLVCLLLSQLPGPAPLSITRQMGQGRAADSVTALGVECAVLEPASGLSCPLSHLAL